MSAARLLELPDWECYRLVRGKAVGRLCIVAGTYPMAFPISYRVVDRGAPHPMLVMRTKPGATIARSLGPASLEVDEIDAAQGAAWSVIVRGALVPIHDTTGLPIPQPWLNDDRHEWLGLDVHGVTGRRFVAVGGDSFAVEWDVAAD